MKKLIILIVLCLLMLTVCEKEPVVAFEFKGVWISNLLHLPDFKASKMILEVKDGLENNELQSVEMVLTTDLVSIKIDSIHYETNDDSFITHFNFINQYGNIEIFKSDSKMWGLIGYMNIRTDDCDIGCKYDQGEILYFNKKK